MTSFNDVFPIRAQILNYTNFFTRCLSGRLWIPPHLVAILSRFPFGPSFFSTKMEHIIFHQFSYWEQKIRKASPDQALGLPSSQLGITGAFCILFMRIAALFPYKIGILIHPRNLHLELCCLFYLFAFSVKRKKINLLFYLNIYLCVLKLAFTDIAYLLRINSCWL